MSVELDELVEHSTLLDGDHELVASKRGATRFGFALLLKFYTRHGRFPSGPDELPEAAVEFVARQVDVAAGELTAYEWSERTERYHRAQVREHLGFRECTVEDAPALQGWLAEHVARADPRMEVVRDELLGRCRKWRIEPPSDGRIERIVRAAVHGAQAALCERTVARLSEDTVARIEALVAVDDDHDDDDDRGAASVLGVIKSVPGRVTLDSML